MGASADGAEITTFFAPPSICACALSKVVKIPVHSATISTPIAPQPISVGLRSAVIIISSPSTIKLFPFTSVSYTHLPSPRDS